MPTIQYLSSNNSIHNLTSYTDTEEAKKSLFVSQYVSSRLFKISNNTIPSHFHFIGDLNKSDDSIHNILLKEYYKRTHIESSTISVESFLSSDFIQTLKNKEMVPSSFEKDYLLLDLLLTNKVLKEKGIDGLNDYSKSLLNFVKNLTNKDLQEININIELVNEIINTDTNNLIENNNQIKKFNQLLEQSKNKIETQKEEINEINITRNKLEKESQYIDSEKNFSSENIDLLKRNRLTSDKNSSLIDKLQLKIFKFLGKSTSGFYKDGLDLLEEQLKQQLIVNKLKFETQTIELDEKISLIEQSIKKIKELEQVLKSISYSSILSSQNEMLDNDYIRNVPRIMSSNNAIFLHSISDVGGSYPEDNSPLQKNVSLSDKIDQIRCFNPSLSCSSFKLDNNSTIREFASAYGVIINNGTVQSASSCDSGTTVSLTGEREQVSVDTNLINDIINKKNTQNNSYDEFAISNSQIAGIYLNYDRIISNVDEKSDELVNLSFMKIMSKLKSYQDKYPEIPLMIIKDGNIHEVTPNFQNYNKESFVKHIENIQENIGSSAPNNSPKKVTYDSLNYYFNISSKKSVAEVIAQQTELSLEKKIERGLMLVDNYKPKYQEKIWENIDLIKSRITSIREKYVTNDNDEKKTLTL